MTFSRVSHLALFACFMTACASNNEEDLPPEDTNEGIITSLMLHFTPVNGGETLSFRWTTPEDDAPVVDDIPLPDRTNHGHHDRQSYTLNVEMWNEQDTPATDMAQVVADNGVDYQIFFTGSAVDGPATADNSDAVIRHIYDDVDANGYPLGLNNTIDTMAWGAGELTVTLRHMPPEDDSTLKAANLAEDVAENGFDAIGGETVLQATFDIDVE